MDGGVRFGLIEKTGSWFSYNGEKIGQGRDNAVSFLKSNPQIMSDIEAALRKLMFQTEGE